MTARVAAAVPIRRGTPPARARALRDTAVRDLLGVIRSDEGEVMYAAMAVIARDFALDRFTSSARFESNWPETAKDAVIFARAMDAMLRGGLREREMRERTARQVGREEAREEARRASALPWADRR